MNEFRRTGAWPRALTGTLTAAMTAALTAALAAALWTGAASAQAPASGPITDEQLARLRNIAIDKGSTMPVPAPIATVLRLSSGQVAPAVRQVSFQGDDGVKHGFAHLNDDSGYFFFRRSPTGLWAFHTDRDLKLVIGAHNFSAQQFIALPEPSGREELAAELSAWSRVLSAQAAAPPVAGAVKPSGNLMPVPAAPMPGAAPAPAKR